MGTEIDRTIHSLYNILCELERSLGDCLLELWRWVGVERKSSRAHANDKGGFLDLREGIDLRLLRGTQSRAEPELAA